MTTTMDKNEIINLTNGIQLSPGCHILYTYSNEEKYLENVTSYISEGIDNNQVVIYGDSELHLNIVKNRLKLNGYSDIQIQNVNYMNIESYGQYGKDTTIDDAFHEFQNLLKPYIKDNKTIRTWGIVDWEKNSEEVVIPQLRTHETRCDCLISDTEHMISVCAYDISKSSAPFLLDLLSLHEYHMTDDILAPSHLYHKKSVIFPSISEQIKLEKAAQGQLLRSEKLSVAGQLAAGIAHEIRNPITAIKGFLKLLMVDEGENHYLRIINDEVEKIEMIASEFLILAKPHIEEKKRVDVIRLINSVKILLEAQALGNNVGLQFEYENEKDELLIICDEMKLRQVLINLIKNAIEVMENGFITLSVKDLNDAVLIKIVDEGPGMPQDIVAQIGQPFFTTKKNGTGLGLFVCQKIIENHKGKLDVESEEGKGTTFKIRLPKN